MYNKDVYSHLNDIFKKDKHLKNSILDNLQKYLTYM